MKHIAPAMLYGMSIGLLIAYVALLLSTSFDLLMVIPDCPTEDSNNCYWDADVHGNGSGRSFVTINDQTYYLGE